MPTENIKKFLNEENNKMKALYQPVLLSNWKAATTGEKIWSKNHEQALSDYFKNFSVPERFEQVKLYRQNQSISPLQKRQLDDLYHKMITNQLDETMRRQTLTLERDISHIFNTFRPTYRAKKVSNNDLLDILKNSKDSSERKKAWLASKQVGKKIEGTLLQLVDRRNKNAQSLGFDNFYHMSFAAQELDIDHVFGIFKQLKQLSDKPFRRVKHDIDQEITRQSNRLTHEIRPWHYTDPFFQEAPPVDGINFDQFYKDKNLENIARLTFQSMGLSVDDILERSDLYPREHKNPFGFCTNIDREGDIRILINMNKSLFWMTALLHELGHAVYFKYINRDLPFLLRFHSHTLTTEAIALLFGRMNKTWEWYQRFLQLDSDQLQDMMPSITKMLQRQMLVSMRWILTFSYFERELYERPEQNLNQRWWELVEDIQFVNPPELTIYPDWAAKMHFSLAPVSYQNYLLGELTASQLQAYIEHNISEDMFSPIVGTYLKEKFFSVGNCKHWNVKIKSATDEYLNPVYFVNQFL